MATINLRDFYPWYTQDIFVEVSDAVAEELLADKRYQKSHWQRQRRNKAFYSLDVGDGIENGACFAELSPHEVMERRLQWCRLCRALNSLSETQGRRIEAHYILGKSKVDIARDEGVAEKCVRRSIEQGLWNMKKYMQENF
ncbi:MAG: sigma-70 family RNA polymerase sigma factor [Oscillospiraceae bacterium]|nr:sigma-70 family RNA polymerase sigma factor [Oscillospiraceae bacterium]